MLQERDNEIGTASEMKGSHMQKIWLQTLMESRGSGAFMERQSIHIKEIEYAMKRAQENS